MPKQRGREDNWSQLAIIGALAAMVVVMAVTAFTLHKGSSLVATRPQMTMPEPATYGKAETEGLLGRERSVESGLDQHGRERAFVPSGPGVPPSSTSTP